MHSRKRLKSHRLYKDLSPLKDLNSRNARYTERQCKIGVVINIALTKLHLTRILLGKLIDDGS